MLGISITTSSKIEILEEIQKYLELSNYPILKLSNKRQKPFIIVTPNPEQVMLAQKDKHFAGILNQADVAIPDGIGLVAAMRLLAQTSDVRSQMSEVRRIPGVEFMEDLVGMAAERGYQIALIGGRGGVAVEALECLQRKHQKLVGWVEEPGELSVGHLGDLGNLSEKIRKTNTRLVFVGLGAPKQEYFIEKLREQMTEDRRQIAENRKTDHQKDPSGIPSSGVRPPSSVLRPLILMSVGGAFDIISGRTPRAPRAIQVAHLEWLWRLFKEPWRWRRQRALLKFLWLVVREKEL